ncbi:hypothetical protein I3843_07G228100 [Carya illinoinensis]|uniref:Uncharacterized protein n=1 Tax=Carya illinoinensis TaxID=32201 RepID=A0A922JFJ3_CARIL|nr:hypothetical protein I3760_07G228800 [Carya illinoinensis]KAG6706716.1 hypothetical protein I3842_07G234900 [Carya illinoinensis]KAG7973441.1 hypothetical protein I3843_07G228100 [Carya illinoinensis]
MASKLCDSCQSATATLFCRADSAFLCLGCNSKVHAANKLASRHARVFLCEVCEHAPAHVTCKADAASLCVTCDRDIHSANPLARRHDRVPVTTFYDSVNPSSGVKATTAVSFLDDHYVSDEDGDGDVCREEAEAASWLLPNHNNNNNKVMSSQDANADRFIFTDMDPYLDMDYGTGEPELEAREQNSPGNDGVVPVQSKSVRQPPLLNDHCFDMKFSGSKLYAYGCNSRSLSHSVSSSSLDVGVVPDGNTVNDISDSCCKPTCIGTDSESLTVQISAADREARVLRYREKRKNRKFEKTIRYASRKAYAETRPRIKGRFAKRSDVGVADDGRCGYGVVPTF